MCRCRCGCGAVDDDQLKKEMMKRKGEGNAANHGEIVEGRKDRMLSK